MKNHKVVSKEQWLLARKAHLAREKEFTRQRDQLSKERRELPWVKVDKQYSFEGANGSQSLENLFDGRSQLIIYHFMFGPDWQEGCPSCSFWADNFNGIGVHLNHRDINMIAVSRAPFEKLQTYRERMGWVFPWFSSYGSDFNYDFQASFSPEEMAQDGVFYNYEIRKFPSEETPGISVFYKNEQDEVFHTYSCYSRGLDMLNGAYHHMDLAPKGRDEDDLAYGMAWLKRHDQYQD